MNLYFCDSCSLSTLAENRESIGADVNAVTPNQSQFVVNHSENMFQCVCLLDGFPSSSSFFGRSENRN